MKIWVYVEGESDQNALAALWGVWIQRLRPAGHGIKIVALANKAQFLRKVGHRAARVLCENNEDIVIGLPDLYPNKEFETTKYKHQDVVELKAVQVKEVSEALRTVFNVNQARTKQLLERFLPSALKHDLEMLLLAAQEQLRSYLGTSDQLGDWRNPVEEQNQNQPPKHLVEHLFRTKSVRRRAYRDTKDASGILRNVTDMKTILYDATGQVQCPVFKGILDWIGQQTGIRAYE